MEKDAHPLSIWPWTLSRYLKCSAYSCYFYTAQAIKRNLILVYKVKENTDTTNNFYMQRNTE